MAPRCARQRVRRCCCHAGGSLRPADIQHSPVGARGWRAAARQCWASMIHGRLPLAVSCARRCAASHRWLKIRHSSVRRLYTLILHRSRQRTHHASCCGRRAPRWLPLRRALTLLAKRGPTKMVNVHLCAPARAGQHARHRIVHARDRARLIDDRHPLSRGAVAAAGAHAPGHIQAERVHQVVGQHGPHAPPRLAHVREHA